MDSEQRPKAYPSSESVGGFYDQMDAFFASVFGENIHLGIWDGNDGSSLSDAQTRLTDRLIDLLNLTGEEYLLDVGCGTGHPATRLVERTGARVLGVTISRSQLDLATAKAQAAGLESSLEFILADAMDLPCESEMFDAAWAIEMLFQVPDRLQVLREIRRTLKPGGKVVLADFVEHKQLDDQEWQYLTEGFAFSSLIRAESYGDVVAEAGLEPVRVHDVTEQIKQNLQWFLSRFDANRETLADHYGPAFTGQMDQFLPMSKSIYTEKLGYVIVEARRPTAG